MFFCFPEFMQFGYKMKSLRDKQYYNTLRVAHNNKI
jgi:hypothetical protein